MAKHQHYHRKMRQESPLRRSPDLRGQLWWLREETQLSVPGMRSKKEHSVWVYSLRNRSECVSLWTPCRRMLSQIKIAFKNRGSPWLEGNIEGSNLNSIKSKKQTHRLASSIKYMCITDQSFLYINYYQLKVHDFWYDPDFLAFPINAFPSLLSPRFCVSAWWWYLLH
jgi:hypothetical protein